MSIECLASLCRPRGGTRLDCVTCGLVDGCGVFVDTNWEIAEVRGYSRSVDNCGQNGRHGSMVVNIFCPSPLYLAHPAVRSSRSPGVIRVLVRIASGARTPAENTTDFLKPAFSLKLVADFRIPTQENDNLTARRQEWCDVINIPVTLSRLV